MFQDMPARMTTKMHELERRDAADRLDGTPRLARLRQVPPETGRFLALVAATAPAADWVEVGTSVGYSALWLALACRARGHHLTTYEVLDDKAREAHETIAEAGVDDVVRLVLGDFLQHVEAHDAIGFCFLDAEKEVYADCYEAVVPRLVPGGLLVADNATSHRDALAPVLERASSDTRVDAVVVPIGKGELLCRRI